MATETTTYRQTYLPPGKMPGYAGYTPRTKFSYGETAGAATAQFFLDYRFERLNNATSRPEKGGDKIAPFPIVYRNPALVVGTRDRSRERWLPPPRYRLINDGPRKDAILAFDKMAQRHREFYSDRTGTAARVTHFVFPEVGHGQCRPSAASFNMQQAVSYSSRARSRSAVQRPMSSRQMERQMRDVVFENRCGTF